MDFNKMSEVGYRGTINPFIYNNEVWLKVSDYIPEVLPWYWVSNTGKIYSEQIGYILRYDYVGKGYLKVTLQTINGPKDMLVHRIVMLCFHPIPNSDDFTVNHKDGNHENNFESNLEWATYNDQMEHASVNNLLNKEGYSEEEVIKICELLEKISNQDEIIRILYGDIKKYNHQYYIRIKHLVNRIQTKQSWIDISCKYNILPKDGVNPNQLLTDNQIEQLCSILQDYGKNISTRKAFSLIGIDIGQPGEKMYIKYMATMVNIRNRKCFDYITSKYNF